MNFIVADFTAPVTHIHSDKYTVLDTGLKTMSRFVTNATNYLTPYKLFTRNLEVGFIPDKLQVKEE